ncbi:hypothetical protein GCM10010336_62240 [Streptomyces goshikiensis]|nr:hypothetical protein GCM10010336_62240 [Streptomyces goshikiensis]
MTVSPSSAAQAARRSVAHRLRELRAEAGLSGSELGLGCGWTHSKSSRIENAWTLASLGIIPMATRERAQWPWRRSTCTTTPSCPSSCSLALARRATVMALCIAR